MEAVFVGGCERSGTTFLGSLLGSHADCLATPESHFKIEPLLFGVARHAGRIEPRTLRAVERDVQFRLWEVALNDQDAAILEEAASAEQVMFALVRAYARNVGKERSRFWIDHTPSNIKYATRLGSHFPSSKFINVIRDGRGVAASFLKVKFGPNTIKACADHWMGRIAVGLAAEMAFPQKRILRVRYEDLVERTEDVLKEICRFLGIEFQEQMISGRGFKPVAFGRKVNRLVGQPASPERLTAWESVLTLRQVEIFEAWTGDLLPCLGYDLRNSPARGPTWPEKLQMDFKETFGKVVNATTYRLSQRRHAAAKGPAARAKSA